MKEGPKVRGTDIRIKLKCEVCLSFRAEIYSTCLSMSVFCNTSHFNTRI